MRLKMLPVLALATLSIGAAPPPHSCTPGPYLVFFDLGSSAIKKDAREILDNAIENEGDCGPMNLVLAGHADTSEKPAIARTRALAVSNYLASRGIFVKRRNILSFGARALRVRTPPKTEERQNRRVELTYGPDI
jgi:outer membrane protein OmpA-like peptidoglycan-associated protein